MTYIAISIKNNWIVLDKYSKSLRIKIQDKYRKVDRVHWPRTMLTDKKRLRRVYLIKLGKGKVPLKLRVKVYTIQSRKSVCIEFVNCRFYARDVKVVS